MSSPRRRLAAYRAALEEMTRERVPLDWAMAQANLGTALFRLGARESGTARLEEAVAVWPCLTVVARICPEEWVQHTRSRLDRVRAVITQWALKTAAPR